MKNNLHPIKIPIILPLQYQLVAALAIVDVEEPSSVISMPEDLA